MKTKRKALLLSLCAVLLVVASVMGTMAYLTSTDTVNNTFTVGKVKITLDEAEVNVNGEKISEKRVQDNEYKLMPGHTYIKDPTVTVKEGSEDSYVRLKVTFNNVSKLEAMLPSEENLEEYTDEEIALVRKLSPILFLTNYTRTGYAVWNPEFNMIDTDEMALILGDTKYYVYDAATDSATFIFYYPAMVKAEDVADGDLPLAPIFTEITLPDHVTAEQLATLAKFKITAVAEAIQADGFTDANGKPDADAAWTAFAAQQ